MNIKKCININAHFTTNFYSYVLKTNKSLSMYIKHFLLCFRVVSRTLCSSNKDLKFNSSLLMSFIYSYYIDINEKYLALNFKYLELFAWLLFIYCVHTIRLYQNY